MFTESALEVEDTSATMALDIDEIITMRNGPGILVLDDQWTVLHMNDVGWEVLTMLRRHGPSMSERVIPGIIVEVCERLRRGNGEQATRGMRTCTEVTQVVSLQEGALLIRAMALESTQRTRVLNKRFLVMLEPLSERRQVMGTSKARYGLTSREWEVVQALTHGFTNKEIGSALGICEPTVKAHIKHIMEKKKCTTRTGIVSRAVGSEA